MTAEPKTSEQPSGHLRWVFDYGNQRRVLQQLWYITTYPDDSDWTNTKQVEEWRDVPFVSE